MSAGVEARVFRQHPLHHAGRHFRFLQEIPHAQPLHRIVERHFVLARPVQLRLQHPECARPHACAVIRQHLLERAEQRRIRCHIARVAIELLDQRCAASATAPAHPRPARPSARAARLRASRPAAPESPRAPAAIVPPSAFARRSRSVEMPPRPLGQTVEFQFLEVTTRIGRRQHRFERCRHRLSRLRGRHRKAFRPERVLEARECRREDLLPVLRRRRHEIRSPRPLDEFRPGAHDDTGARALLGNHAPHPPRRTGVGDQQKLQCSETRSFSCRRYAFSRTSFSSRGRNTFTYRFTRSAMIVCSSSAWSSMSFPS